MQNNNFDAYKIVGPGTFKRLLGSMLISFGIVMIIYIVVVGVKKGTSDDISSPEQENLSERISEIKELHDVFNELDELYALGQYEKMLDFYTEKRYEIKVYDYQRSSFINSYEAYRTARDSSDEFELNENPAYYNYSSWLYDVLSFTEIGSSYKYKSLTADEREIIDEKISEMTERVAKRLYILPEAVSDFAQQFKDGDYISYEKTSDYAKKVMGE